MKTSGLGYMVGLVRQGTCIPFTMLNINFSIRKKFVIYFINIFFCPVDNSE